jgi:hypothetical protein
MITPWLFRQRQQIQSTSRHRSTTLRAVEKSTWWGTERNSQIRWSKGSNGRLMRNSLAQPVWSRTPKEERGTMVCRMTRVCQKMSLGMALPLGDTTHSSIHGAHQIEINFRTGHDQSVRKSVGSSTRGSRSTALRCRMPWPQGCSSIN